MIGSLFWPLLRDTADFGQIDAALEHGRRVAMARLYRDQQVARFPVMRLAANPMPDRPRAGVAAGFAEH